VSPNKKTILVRGVPHLSNRQVGSARPFAPVVVQLKTQAAAQSINRPVAPPVYRPQPLPRVLQTKSSSYQSPQTGQAARRPVAPPVYHPEAKKVVQAKPVAPYQRSLTPPPVYRPQQKSVAQSKMAPSLLRNPRGPTNRQTIQRKIWRFDGSNWVMDSSEPTDKDPYPDPVTYCAALAASGFVPVTNDRYNQETGEYKSVNKELDKTQERAGEKKGGGRKKRVRDFGGKMYGSEEREPTVYGCFPKTKGRQGPHSVAHVMKRAVFDMGQRMFLDPLTIIDSKLLPKPRQASQMVQDLLADRGLAVDQGALCEWYQEYKKAYTAAKAKGDGWELSLKKAMELHPLTVYRVGEKARKKDLKRKQESAKAAVHDVRKILACDRSLGLPPDLKTVDLGYQNQKWQQGKKSGWDKRYEDFAHNYAKLAVGRPPSPSDYPLAPKSPEQDDS